MGVKYCQHVIGLVQGLESRGNHVKQESEGESDSGEDEEEEEEELNPLLLDPGQWKVSCKSLYGSL